ncbi:hypothetical protein [Streptacidiphilus anmyonensis]|uniref:hypothetical protein n=1 Tax=Streptacidiphilus anmyonensis TaxID=405782 RepID=UPI0005AA3601|nr:hypothetical protein [Streptacidiphilus anmyonensis]
MVPKLVHAAALVVAVAALTSCAGRSAPPHSDTGPYAGLPVPQAVAVTAAPALAEDFTLPVDAYELTSQQQALVQNARNSLTDACLRRFGLSADLPTVFRATMPPNAFRYGPVDLAQAADGYHWMKDQGRRQNPRLSADQTLSPVELGVLNGKGAREVRGLPVPQGGCAAEADRALAAGGGTTSEPVLAEQIDDSYTKSQSSPQVQRVFRQWSACMERHGYHYATPIGPSEDPHLLPEPSGPDPGASSREIAVAQADVACKDSTGLVAVWSSVEATMQRQAIARHAAQLRTLQQQNAATVRNAAAVMAASGVTPH